MSSGNQNLLPRGNGIFKEIIDLTGDDSDSGSPAPLSLHGEDITRASGGAGTTGPTQSEPEIKKEEEEEKEEKEEKEAATNNERLTTTTTTTADAEAECPRMSQGDYHATESDIELDMAMINRWTRNGFLSKGKGKGKENRNENSPRNKKKETSKSHTAEDDHSPSTTTIKVEPGTTGNGNGHVRITTRMPGSRAKIPANVEVICLDTDDEEEEEEKPKPSAPAPAAVDVVAPPPPPTTTNGYTSSEAERNDIIAFYKSLNGDVEALSQMLPHHQEIEWDHATEIRRIQRILYDAERQGFVTLHEHDRACVQATLDVHLGGAKRKRTSSEIAVDEYDDEGEGYLADTEADPVEEGKARMLKRRRMDRRRRAEREGSVEVEVGSPVGTPIKTAQ